MIVTRELDHVGVSVENARAAADWYINTMGFEEIGNFQLGTGHTLIFVRSDKMGLNYEFVQPPPESRRPGSEGRVDHMAYVVDDLDAAFEDAKKRGYEIIEGIIELPELWTNGFRFFMVRAAGGERVEFCSVL